MARKVVTTTTETLDAAGAEGDEMSLPVTAGPIERSEAEAEINPIDELMAAAGADGVKYTITKLAGRPGERLGYCEVMQSGDLSLDALRERWGPGKYQVRATDPQGRFVARRTVEVAAPLKADTPLAPMVAPAPDFAGLAQILASGNDKSMAMMMQMMQQTTQVLTAVLSKPVPVPPAGPTVIEIVQLIKSLDSGKDTGSDMIKVLLQGLELGKEVAGAGSGDDSMLGLAGKGLDMIRPLIERGAVAPQSAPTRPPAALPPPKVPTVHPPGEKPAPAVPEENVLLFRKLQWVKANVNVLVAHAAKNKDPSLYAEVFLDNLPEFMPIEEVQERFATPDAIAQLAQVDARVTQYAAWFERFRQEVLALLNDEGGDEGGEEGETHDEPISE